MILSVSLLVEWAGKKVAFVPRQTFTGDSTVLRSFVDPDVRHISIHLCLEVVLHASAAQVREQLLDPQKAIEDTVETPFDQAVDASEVLQCCRTMLQFVCRICHCTSPSRTP